MINTTKLFYQIFYFALLCQFFVPIQIMWTAEFLLASFPSLKNYSTKKHFVSFMNKTKTSHLLVSTFFKHF